MAAGESYEEFVEKFKPKKTTDDCYTPPSIYAVIRDWTCKEYGIDPSKIVRPFYPGGDYEHYDYPADSVVIGIPPFFENHILLIFIFLSINDYYCNSNNSNCCNYIYHPE